MMIEDREVIFFTQGGDYVAPLLFEGGADGGGSSSGLPAVVGAYKVRNADAINAHNDKCWSKTSCSSAIGSNGNGDNAALSFVCPTKRLNLLSPPLSAYLFPLCRY